MSGVWIFLSLMLSLVLGLFLAAPLAEVVGTEALKDGERDDRSARLSDSKERALRALKDLELDYRMGKVSQTDFERSKQELSREVAIVLEEFRRHG